MGIIVHIMHLSGFAKDKTINFVVGMTINLHKTEKFIEREIVQMESSSHVSAFEYIVVPLSQEFYHIIGLTISESHLSCYNTRIMSCKNILEW